MNMLIASISFGWNVEADANKNSPFWAFIRLCFCNFESEIDVAVGIGWQMLEETINEY